MTLPNAMTLLRIAIIPVVVVLLFAGADDAPTRWWAFVLFVASAMTDFLDGWLARALGQESDLGQLFDPIADKMLVVAVFFALVAIGDVAGWNVAAVILIVCRELLISGLREYLAVRGQSLPVSRLAKYKTTAQLIAVASLILAPVFPPIGQQIAAILLWLATVLTVSSGRRYWLDARAFVGVGAGKMES